MYKFVCMYVHMYTHIYMRIKAQTNTLTIHQIIYIFKYTFEKLNIYFTANTMHNIYLHISNKIYITKHKITFEP